MKCPQIFIFKPLNMTSPNVPPSGSSKDEEDPRLVILKANLELVEKGLTKALNYGGAISLGCTLANEQGEFDPQGQPAYLLRVKKGIRTADVLEAYSKVRANLIQTLEIDLRAVPLVVKENFRAPHGGLIF